MERIQISPAWTGLQMTAGRARVAYDETGASLNNQVLDSEQMQHSAQVDLLSRHAECNFFRQAVTWWKRPALRNKNWMASSWRRNEGWT